MRTHPLVGATLPIMQPSLQGESSTPSFSPSSFSSSCLHMSSCQGVKTHIVSSIIYARENPAREDLAPGNCTTSLSSNATMATMMLNNSYFNSSRVREESRGSMTNSLSLEEMLLEVCFPSPTPHFLRIRGSLSTFRRALGW